MSNLTGSDRLKPVWRGLKPVRIGLGTGFDAMIISNKHESVGQYVPPFTSVVAPVAKHTDSAYTSLYSAQIMTKYVNLQFIYTNFLIDLESPFTWYDCVVQWNSYPGSCPGNTVCLSPVSCEEYQCTDVRTSTSDQQSSCPPVTNSSTLPELWFNATDGRTTFPNFYGIYPNSACAPSSTFETFPKNVSGVVALSSSSHALPAYLFGSLERSFALCLPSAVSSNGVLFLGSSPYHLQSKVDVRSMLSYTPLLKQQGNFGHFIGVNSIVIKTRSIGLPANMTAKISSVLPYTTLRTEIYNQVVRRFSMVTKRLHPTKPVTPFGLCFKIFNNGTRLKVPDINFGLQDGKKWTVSTANSMNQVTKDVACLAFVDGGATTEHAIVIGTFQMEDNFLLFDLVNSTLGFSSSLLSKGTSCASFNFTGI
ncbi:hypothetical protein R6Q59_013109 [Mikania micrantha]